MSDIYAQSGVNLGAGDSFSKYCYELGKSTWKNCPFLEISQWDDREDYFRGDLGYWPINLPEGSILDDALDGVGTKVILTAEAFTPEQGACDLPAMAGGDIVRKGGVLLKMGNVLDVRTLSKPGTRVDHFFRTMMRGFRDAALKEHFVMYRGETAELGVCVGSENPDAEIVYNWAGFATGAKHPSKKIDGSRLAPGQTIVAIKENGFRSNGISAVRRAFAIRFGEQWWNNPEAKPYVKAAAEPSVLWSHFLARMNGWFERNFKPIIPMTAIAHITGGGIPEKLGDDLLFRYGISAKLPNLFQVPSIMAEIPSWVRMPQWEFFRVFNGGQGALVIVPTDRDAECLIRHAEKSGIVAQIAGHTLKTPSGRAPELAITSKLNGDCLCFRPRE